MKRASVILLALGLVLLAAAPSPAVLLTDTYDFSGSRKFKGSDYVTVDDRAMFSSSHAVALARQGEHLVSGSFTIDFSRVSPNSRSENWNVVVGGQVLGALTGAKGANWQSQTFNLTPELIASLNGRTDLLKIELVEATRGRDKLLLDKIAFSWVFEPVTLPDSKDPGDPYFPPSMPGEGPNAPAPVPEPATVLLMGAGLGGFALFRRRFRLR